VPAPRATWLRLDPAANIPVAYVENALYENPKAASVAVIGIPDPRLQERACACVVLRLGVEDFTFAEMQQFLNDRDWPGSTGRNGWKCSPTLPFYGQRQDPEIPTSAKDDLAAHVFGDIAGGTAGLGAGRDGEPALRFEPGYRRDRGPRRAIRRRRPRHGRRGGSMTRAPFVNPTAPRPTPAPGT